MRRCGAGMLTAHPQATQAERATHAGVRTRRTHALGLAYAKAYGHPCGALANRLLRHADALVPFVRIDVVRADTNLAERSIRPLVVRTIRGGSRSAEGTQTRMGRSSMCAT